MKLFLDTTIQIDRIFGSPKRRTAIHKICAGEECCCTTYVLGEFYATIMRDVVTIYHVLLRESDLNDAENLVAELTRNRRAARAHKIFIHLRKLYDNNLEQMKCEVESYFEDLIYMFYRGIDPNLSDRTQCQRGRAQITYEDGIPILTGDRCRKSNCQCDIERFWINHQAVLDGIRFPATSDDRTYRLLAQIGKPNYDVKGNNCRTLGDSVIVLEALDNEGEVCTTNRNDFEPLCKAFQVMLCVPDYSVNSHT